MQQAARALVQGGRVVIGDMIRPQRPGSGGQIGVLTDLYFALTSESGTWSFAEMAAWQQAAGLRQRRPLRLIKAADCALAERVKFVGSNSL